MKLIWVKSLSIPEIKIVRFGRFPDHRGYFAEIFRKEDFSRHPDLSFLSGIEFLQANESYSRKGTIRGLHFQWSPKMGKLIRTIHGRMIDLVCDIRKDSPTFGKILAYDMPSPVEQDFGEWIWVPPGFAHGNFFTENTTIEYFCSGAYNPECEGGISPFAGDLDWSRMDPALKKEFEHQTKNTPLITDKDKNGLTIARWTQHPQFETFLYSHP